MLTGFLKAVFVRPEAGRFYAVLIIKAQIGVTGEMMKGVLLMAVVVLFCAGSSVAKSSQEVRVLVDVSGSMKQNDPENLRVSALRLLTELLPRESRAGIWLFAQQAKLLLAVAAVDQRWRVKALQKSAAIHSRGQRTHIEEALRQAIQGWRSGSGVQKNIILLTDGVVDVSRDAKQSQRSRQRILQQLLPRLSQLGVKVHAVALSNESDEALLQQLSAGSGGSYFKAERADQLQRIFLHLLESAAPPDSLPLTANRFFVDDSIEEVTLLLFRSEAKKPPRLIRPDGVELLPQAGSLGVKWRSEKGFDLLTMEAPMLGEWQIVAAADPDNRAMVVTNLKFRVEPVTPLILPNSALVLQAHLESEGKQIKKKIFLSLVEVSLEAKSAASSTEPQLLQRNETGFYQLEKNLPEEGAYDLTVVADGGTFARVWHQQVQVSWPFLIELQADQETGKYRLNLRTKIEFRPLLASSPQLYQKPDKGVWQAQNLERLEEHVWQASVAAGAQLRVELSLKSDPLQTVTLPLITVPLPDVVEPPVVEAVVDKEPKLPEPIIQKPSPEDIKEPVNWLQVMLVVLAINVILAGVLFFTRRYWQKKRAVIDWPEPQGETA